MAIEIIKQLPEYKFDFDLVKKETLKIIEDWPFPQIGLTHTTNISDMPMKDRLLESVGSIFDRESNTFKYKETDFTEFNKDFRETYLYEMYKSIPNIGRFRIMILNGPVCYTTHSDQTMRYHFAIETNPDCLFLFPGINRMFHIPADGYLYLLDTRYRHNFVNGSRQRRIHLVMDNLSTIITRT